MAVQLGFLTVAGGGGAAGVPPPTSSTVGSACASPWVSGFTKKRQRRQRARANGARLCMSGQILRAPEVWESEVDVQEGSDDTLQMWRYGASKKSMTTRRNLEARERGLPPPVQRRKLSEDEEGAEDASGEDDQPYSFASMYGAVREDARAQVYRGNTLERGVGLTGVNGREAGTVIPEEDPVYDVSDIEFRTKFDAMKTVEWWDAPMKKTMREIRDMNIVEVMVELRDMRLPKIGSHSLFRVWRKSKNLHAVVIYTHIEGFTVEECERVAEYTCKELSIPRDQVFFEDLRNCKQYRTRLLKPAIAKIKELMLRSGVPPKQQVKKGLVVGVPNVGKSSFIYIVSKELTKKKKKKKLYHAPVVADHAGETIRTKSYWFNEKPNLMLIDTPGLFPPLSVLQRDIEAPYKLAAVGSCNLPAIAREFNFMQVEVADYLLFKLNQRQKFRYVKRYGLRRPTDHIRDVLNHMDGSTDKQNALQFIADFNEGHLGTVIFDELTVDEEAQLDDEKHFEVKAIEERARNFDAASERKPRPRLALRSDFWREI